uniref:U-box domain-containing protein n=1 Tax=Glycine max TaxID=3847 RepID=A0A0R0GJK6_SOYBN
MEIDVFFVRERVMSKQLLIYHIPVLDQWVDILTKPLSPTRFELLRGKLNVHRSICLELHRLIDRILHVILAIESARPNCMLAVQALCSLNFTLAEAKSIIKHCSKCSKLYLAITSHKILSRCQKVRNAFELYLVQIQNAVPIPLAGKISAILHDLRGTEFSLEFAEDEARKVLLSLLEKNFPDSASVQKEELEAIQIATSRLEIKSPFSLLVEKATLKKQLEEVSEENLKQKELLQYLLYLLVKHGKSNCQFQNGSHSPKHECHDQSLEHELVVDESSQ